MNTRHYETLRADLQWLAVYSDGIVLRIGPPGQYGPPDSTTTADALLATLDGGELDRPALLIWNWREPGYVYAAGDPLGWIHLYETPEYLAPGPALFVMQKQEENDPPCQNRS